MARGWESKGVEGQVQERESREDRKNKKEVTQSEVEVRRQRGILSLSRARVEIQLRDAQSPRYIEQLTRALADIDSQLAKLPADKK